MHYPNPFQLVTPTGCVNPRQNHGGRRAGPHPTILVVSPVMATVLCKRRGFLQAHTVMFFGKDRPQSKGSGDTDLDIKSQPEGRPNYRTCPLSKLNSIHRPQSIMLEHPQSHSAA